jgi:hypothetical protein
VRTGPGERIPPAVIERIEWLKLADCLRRDFVMKAEIAVAVDGR